MQKIHLYYISNRFTQRFPSGTKGQGVPRGVGYGPIESARSDLAVKRLKTTALNSYPKGKVNKAWKTQWRVFVRLSVLCLRALGSRLPPGGSPQGWCWTFAPLQTWEEKENDSL